MTTLFMLCDYFFQTKQLAPSEKLIRFSKWKKKKNQKAQETHEIYKAWKA